jgi:hypothetical protein
MAFFSWGIGAANAGGTSLCKFANDGDTSFSGPHLTSIFPFFAHEALQ